MCICIYIICRKSPGPSLKLSMCVPGPIGPMGPNRAMGPIRAMGPNVQHNCQVQYYLTTNLVLQYVCILFVSSKLQLVIHSLLGEFDSLVGWLE